jgi:hypothetical protein
MDSRILALFLFFFMSACQPYLIELQNVDVSNDEKSNLKNGIYRSVEPYSGYKVDKYQYLYLQDGYVVYVYSFAKNNDEVIKEIESFFETNSDVGMLYEENNYFSTFQGAPSGTYSRVYVYSFMNEILTVHYVLIDDIDFPFQKWNFEKYVLDLDLRYYLDINLNFDFSKVDEWKKYRVTDFKIIREFDEINY